MAYIERTAQATKWEQESVKNKFFTRKFVPTAQSLQIMERYDFSCAESSLVKGRVSGPTTVYHIIGGAKMAKKVEGYIKLQIPAGKATPAPPVGPALGQHGVNIVEFTKQFNARTADKGDVIIPVVITVYADRSFSFVTKTPPAAVLVKKACNIKTASAVPNKTKVATISKAKVQEIAEMKMPDLNAGSLEAAMSMIAGTARSMGIVVED